MRTFSSLFIQQSVQDNKQLEHHSFFSGKYSAMSTPEVDQTPLVQKEDNVECRDEREAVGMETGSFEIGQLAHSKKSLKSYGILKSALAILTSNFKVVLLMMLSIIPFFVFLVFFEIKLRKVAAAAPSVLGRPYGKTTVHSVHLPDGSQRIEYINHDINEGVVFLYDVLQVSLLFLILFPALELLSMVTTILIAAKVYAGEELAALKDTFCRYNGLKGVLITCFYVQLLSFVSLLGLSWIVANQLIFTLPMVYPLNDFSQFDIAFCVYVLFLGLHAAFFVAVLYNYLYWSAFWNMSLEISVLEQEDAMATFGLAHYYGKHCKATGFQLMLGFVGFSVVLRLPCLYDWSTGAGIAVTAGVIGFICLANLVKWVAFVLYYFDCKQQTMEKKNDEETAKPVNAQTSV